MLTHATRRSGSDGHATRWSGRATSAGSSLGAALLLVSVLNAIGIAVAPAAHADVPATTTVTYTFEGARFFTVPDGVTSVQFALHGGGGGAGGNFITGSPAGGPGGNGGTVTGTLPVIPGEVLSLVVGGGGAAGGNWGNSLNFCFKVNPLQLNSAGGLSPASEPEMNGGNGGFAAQCSGWGAGGGGATELFTGADPVAVAGGGGGGGGAGSIAGYSGGAGGNNMGQYVGSGSDGTAGTGLGAGGGGTAGAAPNGGGNGDDIVFLSSNGSCGGGGGGFNGWFTGAGGGAGGGNSNGNCGGLGEGGGGGGGAGLSWADTSVSNPTYTTDQGTGGTADQSGNDGTATITYNNVNPPLAPTGTNAYPGDAQATVYFNPADADIADPVTSYTVTATDLTNPGNGGQTITGTASPIVVPALYNGDTYTLSVTATNDAGVSPVSSASNAIVPATAPSPPVVTQASPHLNGATVFFAAPNSDGGNPVTSYTVTATDYTTPANGGQTATGTGSPIAFNDLTPGDSYAFSVTAENSAGTSASSGASNTVVPEQAGAPVALQVVRTSSIQWPNTYFKVFTIDSNGNQLSDVSSEAQVSISPGGSCAVQQYTGIVSCALGPYGGYVVSATDGNLQGSSFLPYAGSGAALTAIDPSGPVSGVAGVSESFSDLLYDSYGNVTDMTSLATFTMSGGTCDGNVCTPGQAGAQTVTANLPSEGGAVLPYNVATGPLASIVLTPSQTTTGAGGGSQSYTAEGYDAGGNDLGDVTSATTFAIAPDGNCQGATCSASVVGPHVVSAVDSTASGVATLTVPATAPGSPTGVAAFGGDRSAQVAFTAPADGGSPITGYQVTATDVTNPSNGGQTASGTFSPVVVTGLTNGDQYTFTVTATNGAGTGPVSAASPAATPTGSPGAPTITSVTAGDAQTSVAFTAPLSNGGNSVYSFTATATDLTNPSAPAVNAVGTGSPIVVYGLVNGDSYHFTVSATNDLGVGPVSQPSASVVPVPAPTISLSPAAATPGTSVTVSGKGYTPGDRIAVSTPQAPGTLGTAVADNFGGFSVAITIPSLAGGLRSFVAKGAAAGDRATASLQLLPEMSLKSTQLSRGQAFGFTVRGFRSGQVVTLHLKSPTGIVISQPVTSTSGDATGTGTIPARAVLGANTIYAVGGGERVGTSIVITMS